MSMCAHGPSPANSCRNSAASTGRALPQVGRVLHVGERRVDVAAVARVERERPGVVAARLGRARGSASPSASSFAKTPGVEVAERELHRAGERREVEDVRRALRARVPERVREHEPSLGVGVRDLDRLAVRGARMSPGRNASPPGMFSAARRPRRREPAARARRSRRCPAITAAPPAMSPFMSSMPSAGLSEIPPVSNVIALPTSPSMTSAVGARRARSAGRSGAARCALPRRRPRTRPCPARRSARGPSASTRRSSRRERRRLLGERPRASSSFGGAFARSRARATQPATRLARSAAALTPSPRPATTTREISRAASFDFHRPRPIRAVGDPLDRRARLNVLGGTPSDGSIAQPTDASDARSGTRDAPPPPSGSSPRPAQSPRPRRDPCRLHLAVQVHDDRRPGLAAQLGDPLEPRPDPLVEARHAGRVRDRDAEYVDVERLRARRAHLHLHRGRGCYRVGTLGP